MITLTDFLTNELKKYNLQVNKKNLAKLRHKYTKELKAKNLWDKAEIKLIEKSKTRIFKEKDLEQISYSLHNYMTNLVIKESGFSKSEIKKTQKENAQAIEEGREKWLEYIETHTPEEIYDNENYSDPAPSATKEQKKQGLNELMLTALFNKFFKMTPEQKNLFFNDLSTNNWDGEMFATDENWIISQKRLKHPEKYYYSER